MLGRYLKEYISMLSNFKVIPVSRSLFEVTKETVTGENISNFLSNLTKDCSFTEKDKVIVFNAIGIINVVKTTDDMFILVNTTFPRVLANVCESNGWICMHASTDCVFSGKTLKWYTEHTKEDPIDIYGKTKLSGEPENGMVIRCSIIGVNKYHKDRGFINFLLNSKEKGKSVSGYTTHLWNGITCLEYAKMIVYLIENEIFWRGVRHIEPPYFLSKYEMCLVVNEVFNLKLNIKPVTPDKSNKVLRTKYNTDIPLNDFKTQIKELYLFDSI